MRQGSHVWLVLVLVGAAGLVSCRREPSEKKKSTKAGETPAVSKADLDIRTVPKTKDAPDYIRDAVKKAATFFRNTQCEDGGWGVKGQSDVGITGLVVRALARAPEEIRKANQDLIDKGAAHLVANRRDDGSISHEDKLVNYRTSIAARALIAVDPEKYEDTIAAAVNYTHGIQGADPENKAKFGSMGYGSDETKGDAMNTVEALQLLAESGLSKDDPAFERAKVFLFRLQNRDEGHPDEGVTTTNDGGAIYRSIRDVEGASKAGTIKLPDGTEVPKSYGGATYNLIRGLLFCGMEKDNPRVQAAYDWVRDHYSVTEHPEMGQQGLYYYYYSMIRTLELWGSPTIEVDAEKINWAEDLAKELVARQNDDGSWANPEPRWWESTKSLATAYSVLSLNTCARALEP